MDDLCTRDPHIYAVTGSVPIWHATAGLGRAHQPSHKLSRWLANLACPAETLERPCPGDHENTHFLHGRAGVAQVYPPRFCKAIVAGFAEQLKLDNLPDRSDTRIPSSVPVFNLELLQVVPEDSDDSVWEVVDAVNGEALPQPW